MNGFTMCLRSYWEIVEIAEYTAPCVQDTPACINCLMGDTTASEISIKYWKSYMIPHIYYIYIFIVKPMARQGWQIFLYA